jgi:hypothetical protein
MYIGVFLQSSSIVLFSASLSRQKDNNRLALYLVYICIG